ncbi:MAG: multiple antibiotic resistance (MarC)-related protein [Bacteroidetes bacterium]|jgi:multiple antibiotic resistance protein|nr:multiple antibiotic resistance (MarC)-related protein [Bacteroidota bacterium]
MHFSLIQITSAFMVLFAIIDILGSIPIILNIKKKSNKIYALRASSVALGILVLFLFTGEGILKLFNVDIQSFAVAGALVIFIFAIEMILDVEIFRNKGPEGGSSIVPLAFPLIAGPGSFTTLLSLRAEYATENILVALVLNLAFVYLVLKSTSKIEKFIGEAGIYILRKFFGIILLAISVKLFTSNLGTLL